MPPEAMAVDVGHEFETHRRFLWGLAYRLTGSAADADDVVQESFVRALERPPVDRGGGWKPWLTRVTSNLAIDALRRRRRRDYVGPWLPSPIETGDESSPPGYEVAWEGESTEHRYDMLESVSMAFLLALERLTPRQRAVLLLRDVFDYTVQETASALDMTSANVKVVLHRARQAMTTYDKLRVMPTRATQARTAALLQEFVKHLQDQNVQGVESMLAADARAVSDGGGEFRAALNVVTGRDRVARLMLGLAARGIVLDFAVRTLNGLPALLVRSAPGPGLAPRFVFRVDIDRDGRIDELHVILATPKLKAVEF